MSYEYLGVDLQLARTPLWCPVFQRIASHAESKNSWGLYREGSSGLHRSFMRFSGGVLLPLGGGLGVRTGS